MAEERNKHDSMYVKVMNYASATLIAVILKDQEPPGFYLQPNTPEA